MTRTEAAAIAHGNPFSFLHVGRADIDVPADVGPYDDRVYAKARDNLRSFMHDGTFVQEREPSLYLYELTLGQQVQVGVVGCVHVDDYERDIIKKHELTRPDKETDRVRHIVALQAQAEPVFLMHRPQPIVDQLNAAGRTRDPLYDFTSDDDVRHRVWRVQNPGGHVDAFRRISHAYVADGHHRSASALRAARELKATKGAHTEDAEYNWFLAVLFASNHLRILPYNRVVRDLGGLTPQGFLERLAGIGRLEATTEPAPDRSGAFGVYLGGRWYRLTLDPETLDPRDPAKSIDGQLLSDRVLGPILGIEDIRSDPRIDFVGGAKGTDALVQRVDSGEMAAAFSMFAVGVDQVMAVSDQGGIMPPKTTWFEPKLKSGLFIHTFD